MKAALQIPVLSVCLSMLVSCIQHSTVVRVRKDGSGEIFVRNYFSPTIDKVAGNFGAKENSNTAPDNPKAPTAEQLEKNAISYGDGVRFVRHEESKNEDNWSGYIAIYEFDDISQVSLDAQSALSGDIKKQVEATANRSPAEDKSGKTTFQLVGEDLKINSNMGMDALKQFHDSIAGKGAKSANAKGGGKPSGQLATVSNLFTDMRLGYYVRIEGGIAETNASHVKGDYITIIDLDVPKFLNDPEFKAFVDSAAENPGDISPKTLKTLASEIEAMKAEMKPSVTVKFN